MYNLCARFNDNLHQIINLTLNITATESKTANKYHAYHTNIIAITRLHNCVPPAVS